MSYVTLVVSQSLMLAQDPKRLQHDSFHEHSLAVAKGRVI